jgi:hypothetical protein
MKQLLYLLACLALPIFLAGCHKKSDETTTTVYTVEVILKNVPFKTNEFLRIPYSLKTWEWKKTGMRLKQINILDDVDKTIIQTLDSLHLPKVQMDPFPPNPIMNWDKIYNYYFSIQLPIPLDQQPPARISHQLILRDTVHNTDVKIEGGVYTPDYSPTPLAIASPVKGTRWLFFNQSTNDYHFNTMIFVGGMIGTGERFAFDNGQLDENFNDFYSGDPAVNSSYFCYGDTLYAVADGVVVACRDTMTENDGNLRNHLNFKVPIDYAGNYIIIDIGNHYYAMYAHCVRNSFLIAAGDTVTEGQPLALLGNSGNSDAPHLHFQVGDDQDFFMCNGIPFVLKKFTRIGGYQDPAPIPPVDYFNIMNEQMLVMSFE